MVFHLIHSCGSWLSIKWLVVTHFVFLSSVTKLVSAHERLHNRSIVLKYIFTVQVPEETCDESFNFCPNSSSLMFVTFTSFFKTSPLGCLAWLRQTVSCTHRIGNSCMKSCNRAYFLREHTLYVQTLQST